MSGYNTIILKYGEAELTKREFANFAAGDTICGTDREPKELMRWVADDEEEAKAELARRRCEYIHAGDTVSIREYALEYCDTDEDGEFVSGSDFDFAEEDA